MHNLVRTISKFYPNCQVSCSGDPSVYADLVWEGGDPLPTEEQLILDVTSNVKEQVWLQIKAKRDRKKAGGVLVGEKWFHSDDASRIQQLGLVMMGTSIPANLMWKTMDGSFILMTQTLANQIFSTIAFSDQNIFKIAEDHRIAMEASADPEHYDYSTGWPSAYVDLDNDSTT